MLLADVFVNVPVKRISSAFTYRVPAALSYLGPGWRVFVPFGGRKVEGFILHTREEEEMAIDDRLRKKLRDIQGVVDEEAWFTPEMLEAARWMADFYLCSLAETMRLFMPGKSGLKISVVFAAVPREEWAPPVERGDRLLQVEPMQRIYSFLLEEGAHKESELQKQFPAYADTLPHRLEQMLRYGLLRREYLATKRERAKYEEMVCLAKPLTEEIEAAFHRRKKQLALLHFLSASVAEKEHWSMPELQQAGFSRSVVHQAAETGMLQIRRQRVLRDSYQQMPGRKPDLVSLTEDQQRAVKTVVPYMEARKYQGFLLHGVTGSGKTQVYIELARKARAMGRQVVVLVPEIALTGQVVMAFKAYFGADILVVHSQLSLSERNDAMLRARRGEAGVIIGARSALFTPAGNIGLFILDEEQDASYKQDESPRYHARVVAEELARIHHAVLLLGSATPSLETYYRAEQGELVRLSLPKRIGNMPLPHVTSVDMREELRHGNRNILSRALQSLIGETIRAKQQVILMLNRRGFSTFVMCRSCGMVMSCPDCGLPLVYHEGKNGKAGWLQCHHCDIRRPVPDICPKCGSRYIKYFGSGTEKLEQELRRTFPQARVVRMDRDTTGTKFAHQNILEQFRRHAYDILLGTQMVAKGHDIPNVTAVGVISADSSLHMPDFRAAERCFMLITQTAGRAGRGQIPGQVIIQTYNPDHYAVQCGIRQDYAAFCRQELALRKALFYPPYSRLIKLLFQDKKDTTAHARALNFVHAFQKAFHGETQQQVIGPAPAVIAKFRDTYRYVVLVKTGDLSAARSFLRKEKLHLRADVAIDIDPLNTL